MIEWFQIDGLWRSPPMLNLSMPRCIEISDLSLDVGVVEKMQDMNLPHRNSITKMIILRGCQM